MRLFKLLEGIDILKQNCDLETEISDVCYDSRKVKEGSVFVAFKGLAADGHDYIEKSLRAGSVVVVCERELNPDIPHIIVKDARKALALMSSKFFSNPSESFVLIGVTGTNGKTTVTYLIKRILEEALGAKVGLIGTNANMIGQNEFHTERTTPESYELQKLFAKMRDEGCTHVVMEVSSHALYLNRVYASDFDIGVFTNLTQDHLDFHKTMEEYKKAKYMLFDMCRTGIINLDDKSSEEIIKDSKCEKLTYSTEKNEASLIAKNIHLKTGSVEFEAVFENDIDRITLNIPGMFSVYNALAATGAGISLGISLNDIKNALIKVSGIKGRVEVVPTGTDYTVIIDYAHTPDGMDNVISSVRETSHGRVVTLFGCGGDRDRSKRPLMGASAAALSDFVVVTSDNPRTEKPEDIIKDILKGMKKTKCPYVVIPDRREAIRYALEHAKPNDTILLLGKGHETYQEINGVKYDLDERVVIKDILHNKC